IFVIISTNVDHGVSTLAVVIYLPLLKIAFSPLSYHWILLSRKKSEGESNNPVAGRTTAKCQKVKRSSGKILMSPNH
uniref:hypothetical protein n=1 Tax=Photorhabdus sp. RM322S TaxID=3342825 RepID=UPI0036DA67CE